MRTTLISTLIMCIITFSIITGVYLYQEYDIDVLSVFTVFSSETTNYNSNKPTGELIINEHELEIKSSITKRPHYIIKAQLNESTALINGDMLVKLKNTGTDTIVFNNYSPGLMNNMTIEQVTINDNDAKYTFDNNQLVINIDKNKDNNKNSSNDKSNIATYIDDHMKINISFNTSVPRGGTRFGVKDNIWLLTTWYPILNVLDDNNDWFKKPTPVGYGDPFYFDYADYDVYFLAPKNIKWVTSGTLASQQPADNFNLYHWQESTIRNFALVGSKDYTIHEFPTDDDTIIQIALTESKNLKQVQDVLEYSYPLYKDIFGVLPYKTIAVAETSWNTNYALEYPNLAIYSKDLYSQGLLERWLAHEIAHVWWYNAVGNHEITNGWIDEGLVEQATVLYLENRYGQSKALEMRNSFRNKNNQLIKRYPDMLMNNRLDNFANHNQFFDTWYNRSADMFLTLREQIGDIKYIQFLKTLYETNTGTLIDIEQLNDSLRHTIKGSHHYFDDWLNKPLKDTTFTLEATPMPIKINGQHLKKTDIQYIDWDIYVSHKALQDILFAKLPNLLTIDQENGQLYYNKQLIFSLPAKLINNEWLIPIEVISNISESQYIWDFERNLLTINVYYFN